MPVSRLIVCSKTAAWATAIRCQFPSLGAWIRETRSLELVGRELLDHPGSLVAVELTAGNLESLVRWLCRMDREFPAAGVIVLGQRGLEASEWWLREMGAIHVVFSPRDLQPVARLVERLLQHDLARQSLLETPWVRLAVEPRLPWKLNL